MREINLPVGQANMDEGYIKFEAVWEKAPAIEEVQLQALQTARQTLYHAGLIGMYDNGIGFGNISQRWDTSGAFLVSGSKTGGLEQTTAQHYTLVHQVKIDRNTVHCRGPIIASSESMTHAMIYRAWPEAQAVIHVHHLGLWERLLYQVPTTPPDVPYGTPAMAYAVLDLFKNKQLPASRLFAMAGHREGLFVFGEAWEEALEALFEYF